MAELKYPPAREKLAAKFKAMEAQMTARLAEARASFEHRGVKGEAVEREAFREFLSRFLPNRFTVGHGEVIDSLASVSAQTDVVVANEDHPLIPQTDSPGLFFIEGVAAAGEVKTVLTSSGLADSIKNAARFRTLQLSAGMGSIVQSNPSDLARFYANPPWFIFAFESQLHLDSLKKRLSESNEKCGGRTVDAVFVLNRGQVVDFADGNGALKYQLADGSMATGWVVEESEEVLFDFLAWLDQTMPRMIRFEPILSRYMIPHG